MSFPLNRPAKLAVFASGRGSNLAALLEAFPTNSNEAKIELVVSNKKNAYALERAQGAQISSCVFASRNMQDFETRTARALDDRHIDLICLAGFMRVLSSEFVRRYQGRILNIHPSLLPRFTGLHAQRQALLAGVSESGCSVHFVDEGVDTGQIICQHRVPVLPNDTEESLSRRILRVEHLAYPEAVRQVLAGKMMQNRIESLAA